MPLDELFAAEPPFKYTDTRFYIRLTDTGIPELIRLEPVWTDDMQLIPHYVNVFVDEEKEPTLVDRSVMEMIVGARNYSPLELVTDYRHRILH